MQKIAVFILSAFALLLLAGCDMNKPPPGGELTEWALGKASEALESFSDEYGDDIMQAIDDLRNAEYQGGPFENDLDSARAYLLEQLQEKYGIEFAVMGRESLVNYGPFAGATYTCQAAPVDAPEQVTTALVSQTMYQDVRDGYAVYFFKDEAEPPVLELCEAKDYVMDQRISLEMPETARIWTAEDGLERFLAESGAYVKLVLRFPDGLDTETYAEYLYDFLNSVDRLTCRLLLQVKADGAYLFFKELDIPGGFDAGQYTLEGLQEEIEEQMSMILPS